MYTSFMSKISLVLLVAMEILSLSDKFGILYAFAPTFAAFMVLFCCLRCVKLDAQTAFGLFISVYFFTC